MELTQPDSHISKSRCGAPRTPILASAFSAVLLCRQWSVGESEKLANLASIQRLYLGDALALLGESCVDVHLNGASFWSAVPVKVWEYKLGGYQVLKKWLSYREAGLLGRPLHEDEARYFSQVVRRIAAILLMGPALDASYRAILPGAKGFGR